MNTPQEEQQTGAQAIAAERQRQIDEEGYTLSHDAGHGFEPLVMAAVVYAEKSTQTPESLPKPYPRLVGWPWRDEDLEPVDGRTALVKAGALIAAAIDQIDASDGGHR